MIIIQCEQGDAEWTAARLGIPTASRFDRIITAEKATRSKSFDGYAHELIAERIIGYPQDTASSSYMERGKVVEKHARDFYRLQRDVKIEQVGCILRDDRRAGCSPDGLIGADGLLEIKCPTAAVHVGYLLDSEGIGYKQQVQGQLWISERAWVDTVSYHPDLPSSLVRQHRDEKFIDALATLVAQFNAYVDECLEQLKRLGYVGSNADQPALRIA